MDKFYDKHYIATDTQGRITDGWSDGPHPGRDTTGAICINGQGGYQFRLAAGEEENPALFTMDGIPLYRWDGEKVVPRTEEEIAADRIPPLETVQREKLAELSTACNAAITAGCNVMLSDGTTGHISLTAEDQINLTNAYAAVEGGAEAYPYHLDGTLCGLYSAADIVVMAKAACTTPPTTTTWRHGCGAVRQRMRCRTLHTAQSCLRIWRNIWRRCWPLREATPMVCNCIDCGKNIPHGCKRCMECSKKALKTAFAKSPELKQAFKETVDEMRKPENIEKMAHEITSTVQAVAALQQALKDGGGVDAM